MKKIISMILIVIMSFSLVACGNSFNQSAYDKYLAGKSFECDGKYIYLFQIQIL